MSKILLMMFLLISIISSAFASEDVDTLFSELRDKHPNLAKYYDFESNKFSKNADTIGAPWFLTDEVAGRELDQYFYNKINVTGVACVSDDASKFLKESVSANEFLYPEAELVRLKSRMTKQSFAWGKRRLSSNSKLLLNATLIGPQVAVDLFSGGAAKAVKALRNKKRVTSVGRKLIKSVRKNGALSAATKKKLKTVLKEFDRWLSGKKTKSLQVLTQYEAISSSKAFKGIERIFDRLDYLEVLEFTPDDYQFLKEIKGELDAEYTLVEVHNNYTDSELNEIRGAEWNLISLVLSTELKGVIKDNIEDEILVAAFSVVIDLVQSGSLDLQSIQDEPLEAINDIINEFGELAGLVPVVGPVAEHALAMKKYRVEQSEKFFAEVEKMFRFQDAKERDIAIRLALYRLLVIENTLSQIAKFKAGCRNNLFNPIGKVINKANVVEYLVSLDAQKSDDNPGRQDGFSELSVFQTLVKRCGLIYDSAGQYDEAIIKFDIGETVATCKIEKPWHSKKLVIDRSGKYSIEVHSTNSFTVTKKFSDIKSGSDLDKKLRKATAEGWVNYLRDNFVPRGPYGRVSQYQLLIMLASRLFPSWDDGIAAQGDDKQMALFEFFRNDRSLPLNGDDALSFNNRNKDIKRLEMSWVLGNLYISKVCGMPAREYNVTYSDTTYCAKKYKTYTNKVNSSRGWFWHSNLLSQLDVAHGFPVDVNHHCYESATFSPEKLDENDHCEDDIYLTREQTVHMLSNFFSMYEKEMAL